MNARRDALKIINVVFFFVLLYMSPLRQDYLKKAKITGCSLQLQHISSMQKIWKKVQKGHPLHYYEQDEVNERCALCFFGLPRSYKNMVLPSINQNLLKIEAHQNCDIFVHYYNQTSEPKGRINKGGAIDPAEILLLKDYVLNNTDSSKYLEYIYDTDEQFTEKHQEVINKYLYTVGEDGRRVYYPYKDKTWSEASVSNLVRQWHSIQSVFNLMEESGEKRGINYTRVGMFRNDAVYLTPINIFMLDHGVPDVKNKYAVIPPFAMWPLNDRMIYGPYEAVKIWSTKRFELVEKQVELKQEKGKVLHSETIMATRVIPAIEESGFDKAINEDICFIRSRANDEALLNDCIQKGKTREFDKIDRKSLVESTIGRKCETYSLGLLFKKMLRCN